MMSKNGKIIITLVSFLIIVLVSFSGYLIIRKIVNIQNNDFQPDVVPNRLFFSEFDNKKDLKNFEIIDAKNAQNSPSKWEISNGQLLQKSNILKNNPINPGSFLIIKNASDWQNYQADLKFIPVNNGIFGFLIRYANENNFYKITMTCNLDSGGPYLKIEKVQNSQISVLYQVKKCFQINSENNVKIEIINNQINLYLNSETITIYGIDKSNPINSGSFGFLVSNMPDIKIDNLEIKKIINNANNLNSEQVLSNQTEEDQLDKEIRNIIEEIGI